MSDSTIISATGNSIANETVEQFQAGLRGPLLRPGNDAYTPHASCGTACSIESRR